MLANFIQFLLSISAASEFYLKICVTSYSRYIVSDFLKVICPKSHAKTVFEVTTLTIDNETDDDDASQSTEADWVKEIRTSFSAGKTKFKQCSFPGRRRLFLCEELCLVMAFKGFRNLNLISYNDGLIDDGEFIFFYDLYYSILEASSSSRSFCFGFQVKSEYRSRTALDLQSL